MLWLVVLREKLILTLLVAGKTVVEVDVRVAAFLSESLLALVQVIDFLIFLLLLSDFTAMEVLEPMDERTFRVISLKKLSLGVDAWGVFKHL